MKLEELTESSKTKSKTTLTAKEKAAGWIIRNDVKMKIGKDRPFKATDMPTDPSDKKRKKGSGSDDDGSKGLSAAERNK